MTIALLRALSRMSFALLTLAVLLPAGLAAQNYTYVNIDYPGALISAPEAVNDTGKVAGWWQDQEGNLHGYYWDGTNFTSIDYPGSTGTLAEGINNAGVISGLYETDQGTAAHGFILENGVFSTYEYPGYDGQTDGQGINNNGETTGYYNFNGPTGFTDNNGGFSSFGYPQDGSTTFPHALNDSGEVAGYYRIYSNGEIGFVYSGGTFTTFTYPNSYETYGTGINNAGVVVGYANLNTGYSAAFLWHNGVFTDINSSSSPLPYGINNNGQLVGAYFPNGVYHGFLATPGTASQPLQFVPIIPCRVVDTRKQDGQFGGPPITGGTARSFPIPQGGCNIPSNAAAYSLNVTLVPIQNQPVSYLTIWPTGENRPTISTMNSPDGRIKANAAIVPGGTGGAVSVYVTNTTNVVLDIDGYFISPTIGTLKYFPITPCRVADTRSSNYPQGLGTPHLSAGVSRDMPVLSSPCVPSGVQPVAYSFNLTAIPYPNLGDPLGYLEIWPTGYEPQDPVSTLNNLTGTYVANAAIVAAGNGGEVTVYPSSNTDLAIDMDGYFAGSGSNPLSLYTTTPCRVIDTRQVGNGQPFTGTLNPPVNVINSPCGIPGAAQAFVFNATVVPSGGLSYLTLWPDSEQRPVVSTLNAADGWITSNMAIVPNVNGSIDAYAAGTTQLILDISSYFAP